MPVATRARSLPLHSVVALLIVLAGMIVAVVSYHAGRQEELERAEADFTHRVLVRHALAREILGRYEDSLFGLSALFMLDGNVSRSEFQRATSRLEERIAGAQAFEWVPFVPHATRASVEATAQRTYPRRNFEFNQLDAGGRRIRAIDRPHYYPILYIQPLRGNEAALGYDLMSGPTLAYLEQARETRQVTVTNQIRLLQEKENQRGVVMIWPVYRAPRPGPTPTGTIGAASVPLGVVAPATPTAPAAPTASAPEAAATPAVPTSSAAAGPQATPATPAPEVFLGFLQCVFRVNDLLETARAPQAETVLDMLFVDGAENDPARRVLYYRPADESESREPAPSEAEFRAGMHRENLVTFGQRNWRVIYRPQPQWLDRQRSGTPFRRSCALMLLCTMLAGLVQVIGRQTVTIKREVDERTAELAESRRQFATLLHELPGMAYRCTYDEQLNVLFVSEGAHELTGWPAEDIAGGTVHFRDLIHPEDLERVRDATRRALQEHTDVEIEYRIRTRQGAEKWVLSRGRGLYAQDGTLSIFEGLAIDITAQKNAESARLALERKLLEGQKLESLGLLAGGIAHDFNNLLSSVLGNANLARLTLPPGHPVDAQIGAIETASLRAAELCRQMLAYAGKGRFVIEPANLTTLTEDLLPLLRISIARQATLDLQLARDLPAVMADSTQLRQIVMNLVLNAADAVADRGGAITLRTGRVRATTDDLARCVTGAGLPAGEYVFLEVRDTGCGMTPDVLARIFDPFFTTKFAGRGLGLAAVLGIVRGHHGALHVESVPNSGTTFRLLLPPVNDAVAAPKTHEPVAGGRWKHPGQVLVIEDEEHVRAIVVEILKTFGLTVHAAASGTEGIERFRESPERFNLVVLDMLMPGLSGEQTLAVLRTIKPDVRVLLVSGYSEGDVLRRLGGAGPIAFLAKPFTRDGLERRLRELLG